MRSLLRLLALVVLLPCVRAAGQEAVNEPPLPPPSDEASPIEPAASPPAPVAPEPTQAEEIVSAPEPAPPPPPPIPPRAVEVPVVRAPDVSVECATRLAVLEQLMVAQRDRDVAIYRDTNQLITTFGISFAVIGMLGLVAAAFFNYRGMVAIQGAQVQRLGGGASATDAPVGLPGGPVPGMERVQASGQRFQTKMSSLEARLAEIENLTGTHPSSAPAPREPSAASVVDLEETPAPARRVIPRAAILVHKAEALMNLGKLDEATTVLAEAGEIDATQSSVHIVRGRVLEKQGRLGDALLAYERAVECDSANTSALLMKAGVLNRQERFAEALACYEKALEVQQASAS